MKLWRGMFVEVYVLFSMFGESMNEETSYRRLIEQDFREDSIE
jgi:hypothetical protein